MGIEHLVLFKLKEGTTEEQIAELVAGLQTLASLPGVEKITAGKNFSERSKGFNFALRVTFSGRAALDAYLPHPDHVKVKDQFIVPITEDILAVDYEF
ncbi:stress responsive A/B barrel domain protein [Acanthamoeba castellanii str. Neff]|uniref:Stress responsive A/B barrel domain protein n=1 Tax=Acanthamoeba castellanii (strain ATCC 30010 / Neff) TaxID=1257118 RepID=L8GZZ5_ACACF|nr:stress responsive A/B barrel domain protein [Acanthamoeba castellanii str. Neff]ELR17676.1 stress responsive A/B barrel domain protein [Acanthamoeba castellanii str. Neff]